MTLIATRTKGVDGRYMELFRSFPLRPIRNDDDYRRASKVLDDLVVRGEDALSNDELDYLETLEMLIAAHDEAHVQIALERRTPLQRLKYLMKESGMTTADLGRLLGNRGLASLIVSGKRQLSKTHIRKLGEHFRLDPGYFL